MTTRMTKQIMPYHLEVDYDMDSESLPVITLVFGIEKAGELVGLLGDCLGNLTDLTIETIQEVNKNE